MSAAFAGRLISAAFVRDLLPSLPFSSLPPPHVVRALDRWRDRCDRTLGPASATRTIADVAVLALLDVLEFRIEARRDSRDRVVIRTAWLDLRGPDVLVVPWGHPLGGAWRDAVREAIASDGRWVYVTDGQRLRVVDGRRLWSRDYFEVNLALCGDDAEAQRLLWTFLRAASISASPPPLLEAATVSSRHGSEICRALGAGVLEALTALIGGLATCRPGGARAGRRHPPLDAAVALDHSLTLVYRMLFLLFAEARALVPLWHPVYRDRYSLEATLTRLLEGRPPRALWATVQAIARLAHSGLDAGELRVNAFNGRLFAPAAAAAFEGCPVSDGTMARALKALGTTAPSSRQAPRRILYRDIDVEQLGAVYERVLDYVPASDGRRAALLRGGDVRKATGTFYTPREVTSYLVRQTLEPLVQSRTSDEMLGLRLLDPAMGSGAFLVAACRYLASCIEDARIREGRWHRGDVSPGDRAGLRREVASRCLYGVDLNPTAVQVARLSLWLATLAADRPLSFLDHRLVAGDSLVGASPDDVRRQPPGAGRGSARPELLPLFAREDLAPALQIAARVRDQLARDPDVSATVVHEKTRALAALTGRGGPLVRWARLLDLWCAGWFWQHPVALDRALYAELASRVLRGGGLLPPASAEPLLETAAGIAATRRFLHWPLTFPEVFADAAGAPRPGAGFDAVLGNPPWDMVRGDSGDVAERDRRGQDARLLTSFVHASGIYRVAARSHVNRYQLFVERALQLLRPGGRLGLVLPAGFLSDAGAAPLRRHVFDRVAVDRITGIDNRHAIFPIHRSVRFALVTGTSGMPTRTMACRFGLSRADELAHDREPGGGRGVRLTRALLTRISGEEDLAVPEFPSQTDLRMVEGITARHPVLSDPAGWGVTFGRELNASDDRDRFAPCRRGAVHPIVEGKQLEPFRVALDRCRYMLREGETLPLPARHARLAYRDVASAGNRLTLIAAIVPARAVTTHTLFCLRTPLPLADQQVLCGLLNSFVANYLVRLRVSTHVTATLMSRLVVPVVRSGHPAHARLLSLSRRLLAATGPIDERPEYAELQALAAWLYGLDEAEFERILARFPLIPSATRDASLARLRQIKEGHGGTETRRPEC